VERRPSVGADLLVSLAHVLVGLLLVGDPSASAKSREMALHLALGVTGPLRDVWLRRKGVPPCREVGMLGEDVERMTACARRPVRELAAAQHFAHAVWWALHVCSSSI
jgi:hypothetical protein